MTTILGIKPSLGTLNLWGEHDSGACLISDGSIVAIAEEERFTRQKRAPSPSFPENSIRYVLDEAGMALSDVDGIAVGRQPRRYLDRLRRDPETLLPTSLEQGYSTLERIAQVIASYRGLPREVVQTEFEERFNTQYDGTWYFVSHHRCHAASAAYCSGFDEQAVLTIDNAGEDDSTVLWDEELDRMKTFSVTNSIGSFYNSGCGYLGFRMSGRDAGKVMGLASYGEHRDEFERGFDDLVSIGEGTYDVSAVQDTPAPFEELFGPGRVHPEELTKRHEDFAYHLQQKTEEIVEELVRYHVEATGRGNVALAGGVAMNCKMNRLIKNMDCVEDVFIQPAANDSGICLGAALEAYRVATGEAPDIEFEHVYYGPDYSNDQLQSALEQCGLTYTECDDIAAEVAQLLADGEVVGWFQGRMEYGARALGNRSILANPTSQKFADRVNEKVKHREVWRPFAPSMLYEARDEYLVDGAESPFMILLDEVEESKQDEIEAVTHVDGTTRPQTVREHVNERYYRLISEFESITGTPVVLNTSFNVAGEPIVESPQQAIADFYSTGLDALALGDYLLRKS